MIYFNTEHIDAYNYIIHRFLELEVFKNDSDLENMINLILPKYLRREQYQKCEQAFKDLYFYSKSKETLTMNAFHELVLYKFISYMEDKQNDDMDFDETYFDNKFRTMVQKASEYECEHYDFDDDFYSEDYFYDVSEYSEKIFRDTDFLFLDSLYNQRNFGNTGLEEKLGINIDYYFDLLPLDIQKQFKTTHITLSAEVFGFLEYFEKKIKYGSLLDLFWENDEPVDNEKIRIIFDNIMTSYFVNEDIEILWKSSVYEDIIRFEIYKRRHEEKIFLLEIRRANKSYLKEGYEKELMGKCEKYKNANYIVLCFDDLENKQTDEFISHNVYTDEYILYLNIDKYDLRKKLPASKRKK